MSRSDRGAATAELVTALPLLAVLTVVLVWMVTLGATQARLVDAAREAARALARGEAEDVAVARGREAGPPGTAITVARDGAVIRVEARAAVAPPVPTFGLPIAQQHAEAITEMEPCEAC